MKQIKPKSIIKTAQKAAKTTITASLIAELKKAIAEFGGSTKKLEKHIENGASKLAKKIVKEIKFASPAQTDAKKTTSTTVKTVAPSIAEKSAKATTAKPVASKAKVVKESAK